MKISFLFLTFLSLAVEAKEVPIQEPPAKMILLPGGQLSLSVELRFQELMRLSDLKIMNSDSKFQMVATNSDFSKALFLRTDIRIDSQWVNQIFRDSKGAFLWTSVQSKQVALFFYGFQDHQVVEILKQYARLYALKDFDLERSPSSEVAFASGTNRPPLSFAKAAEELGESFLKCGLGYAEGFNSVFWDPVVNTGKSMAYAYNNRSQYWANTLREWETFKDSIRHFDHYVREKYQNYKALPPAEKSRLYCSFVGGGGAGSVASKIAKVAMLGEKSLELESAVGKLPENVPGYQLPLSARKALNDLLDLVEEKKAAPAGKAQTNSAKGQHRLEIRNGRGYVKIGHLKIENDTQFAKLLLRAYQEGAIAEIDAGLITGPKVLNLINRLRSIKPGNNQSCSIRGGFNLSSLTFEMEAQIQSAQRGVYAPDSPRYWRPSDMEDFHGATRDLKLEDICLRFYGSKSLSSCGFLKFEFDSQNPAEIKWRNN